MHATINNNQISIWLSYHLTIVPAYCTYFNKKEYKKWHFPYHTLFHLAVLCVAFQWSLIWVLLIIKALQEEENAGGLNMLLAYLLWSYAYVAHPCHPYIDSLIYEKSQLNRLVWGSLTLTPTTIILNQRHALGSTFICCVLAYKMCQKPLYILCLAFMKWQKSEWEKPQRFYNNLVLSDVTGTVVATKWRYKYSTNAVQTT